MGSQPSVMDVSGLGGNVKVVQTSRRKANFKEIEFSASESPKVSRSRNRKIQDAAAEAVKGGGGGAGDFHSVVQQAIKAAAKAEVEAKKPQYENENTMALETFHHRNGAVYSVLYQNGNRYYMDSWQSMDWVPFPNKWYKKGTLVTETIMSEEQPIRPNRLVPQTEASYLQETATDDREGELELPTAGTITTYLFEETRNVHYYYDNTSGNWVRLPISWELRSQLIQSLLEPIEEALPQWTDRQDMLTCLRASNYDPHDCIATYLLVAEKGHLEMPRNPEDAKILEEKDAKIAKLNKRIEKLKKQLDKSARQLNDERDDRRAAENMVTELKDRVSVLEVAHSNSTATMEALQKEKATLASAQTKSKDDNAKDKMYAKSLRELREISKNLHKEYVKMKFEAEKRFEELTQLMKQTAVGLMKIRLFDSEAGNELEEVREMYRKEALQRKLLYNKLQELKGNIRVFVRCRHDDMVECCVDFPTEKEVQAPNGKRLKFDRVFPPETTQDEVFQEAKPIITSCVDGYNVCILAYGQTGAGKTYTMMGTDDNPGVNVRAIYELLALCQSRENVNYDLKASMVEIYNENIQDLLSSDTKTLDLRVQGKKLDMPGITEMFVESAEDIQNIFEIGDMNRSVGFTKMNSASSRSHLIFLINIEGHDKTSGAVTTGNLMLCDLAGSERVSKTDAQGQRLIEAAAINKSLTSLGQVFTAIRTGQLHVPYRNSKLTQILQPSLGGDSKTCVFVAISPDERNVSETNSTLTFGSNATQTQVGGGRKKRKKQPVVQDAWDVEDAD